MGCARQGAAGHQRGKQCFAVCYAVQCCLPSLRKHAMVPGFTVCAVLWGNHARCTTVALLFHLHRDTCGMPHLFHTLLCCPAAQLHAIKEELENKDVVYPEYYFKPFHAYDQGNLNWLAAYEVEPATYSVALRTFGKIDPTLTPEKAYARLAGGATGALTSYCQKHGLPTTARNIVDVGCSVGMSTRWLASQFPDSQIMGLDLSPYFISVAEWEERKRGFTGASRRIRYVHDRVETSKQLSPASVDWMLFQYVIHECPQHAIKDFIATSARALKPNGVLFFVDNNPRSKTMQGLPPAIAILLKSTEPWSDEYFSFDVEAAMRQGGFKEVVTVEIDHRHRAVMGIKA